ncbi:hypothetical protein ES703_80276 [subsurface metagenome]
MIQEANGGVVFMAKIVPGGSRTGLCGLLNGMLKIKISAAPEKGKANQELVGFLAKKLGVKKKAVSIISGQTKPVKQVQVLGISTETLLKKLNLNR